MQRQTAFFRTLKSARWWINFILWHLLCDAMFRLNVPKNFYRTLQFIILLLYSLDFLFISKFNVASLFRRWYRIFEYELIREESTSVFHASFIQQSFLYVETAKCLYLYWQKFRHCFSSPLHILWDNFFIIHPLHIITGACVVSQG